MIQIQKALLHVTFYKLTGDEIGKIKREIAEIRDTYGKDTSYNEVMPEWSLNSDGSIELTEDLHENTENGIEEYILFDAITTDSVLKEEITNCGLDVFFEKINLNKIIPKFRILKYEDIGKFLPGAEYLILEMKYSSYSFENEYDVSVDTKIIGTITGDDLKIELL